MIRTRRWRLVLDKIVVSDHTSHISHVDKIAKLVPVDDLDYLDLDYFASRFARLIRVGARHSEELCHLLSLFAVVC